MKTIIYYCFLAFAAIALSACSAEDGKTGPAGPQGEQGLPGEDGNANVVYSDWIPIEWDTNNPTYKDMVIEMELPSSVFFENGGLILMYLKNGDINGFKIVSIPYQESNLSLKFIYNSSSISAILFIADSLDGSPITTDFETGEYLVRYILVPGGTPVQAIDLQKVMNPTNIQQ